MKGWLHRADGHDRRQRKAAASCGEKPPVITNDGRRTLLRGTGSCSTSFGTGTDCKQQRVGRRRTGAAGDLP